MERWSISERVYIYKKNCVSSIFLLLWLKYNITEVFNTAFFFPNSPNPQKRIMGNQPPYPQFWLYAKIIVHYPCTTDFPLWLFGESTQTEALCIPIAQRKDGCSWLLCVVSRESRAGGWKNSQITHPIIGNSIIVIIMVTFIPKAIFVMVFLARVGKIGAVILQRNKSEVRKTIIIII